MKIFNLIYKIVYWVLYILILFYTLFILIRYVANKLIYPDAMEGELVIFAIYLIALTWYSIMFIVTFIMYLINKIFKYKNMKFKKYFILSILNPFILLGLIFIILGIGSLFY